MTGRRDGRAMVGLALVVGMAAVFAGYYLVHRPLTPGQALAYAGTVGNVSVAALVVVLGGGLGRWLLRRFAGAPEPSEPGTHAVLAAALGWGAMGLVVLALGLLRLLYAGVLWGAVVVALIGLRREAAAWWGDVLAAMRALTPTDGVQRMAAAYVALALALGALLAAAPPLKWDALVYHLTLPKLYMQAHSVYLATVDFSLFTGMPQLAEMLFTLAHGLRLDPVAGSQAAQLVGWAGGALLVLGLASAAQAHGLPVWLAPASLFASFSVAAALAWGYVDIPLMLMALAMLLALGEWRRWRTRAWLALAGTYGGLAFACKYTGFVVPLGGLAVVAYTLWVCPAPDATPKQRWQRVAMFVFAASVGGMPWLIKNWALTGSPVYPLLLPAADMDEARQWFYGRPDLAERSVIQAGLIFWRAAFLGVQGGNDFDVTLGPLLILLPVVAVVAWRRLPGPQRAAMAPWWLVVAAAYMAWVGLQFVSNLATQGRLFFAALPALALLGAGGWVTLRQLDTLALRVSVVMTGGLALALALSTVELANHFAGQQPLAYLAGLQTARDYEVGRLGGYPLAIDQINALPAGSRVVFLWEARSLNCAAAVTCVPDVVIDRWWHLRQLGQPTEAIEEQWRAEGATHVLIYETGRAFAAAESISPFAPDDWTELEALRGRLRVVDTVGDAYTLYALP